MTFEIAPLGLLACMIVVVLFFYCIGQIGTRQHDDADDPGLRIVHFRCNCCDQLWKGPHTPFNTGPEPLCNACAIRHFPVEAEAYGQELEHKYRTALERKDS